MGLFTLPNMETRDITFDPGPHTYTDGRGKLYTSVTTLIGKVVPTYDAEFWAMYRAIDQISSYRPRPFLEDREIEITYKGKRQKFSIEFLYSGLIPTAKTPDAIRAEWQAITDESCEWGSERHGYLEDCINSFSQSSHIKVHEIPTASNTAGFLFKVTNLQELANSPLQFTYPTIYEKLEKLVKDGWVLYAEKRIYSSYHYVAGTIDLLCVRGKECMIMDWKTNKDKLKFTPGYYKKVWNEDRTAKHKTNEWVSKNDKLLYPLHTVPYCKGMLYTLQLSMYSVLCEMWGLKPVGMVLCHIRPQLDHNNEVKYQIENGEKKRIEATPEFYKIDYLRDEVLSLLEWHINN